MLAPKMAETADFELVQAVRGMAGRISDPSARMTSKMDRSKQRRGLGNPMGKSRGVCIATLMWVKYSIVLRYYRVLY